MFHPIETDLLRCAQAGDNDAFAQLQTRLESPVRRFIWRLIGTHEAEDDIVQDAFIALYNNLKRIQPLEHLRPYLFRIVRNRCYDVLRHQGRFEQVSLDDEPVETWVSAHPSVESSAASPEEATHWLLVYLQVQEAMERLPEIQRETLILYTEHEMSYAEIAQTMRTSIGTVKSRLYYAKQTLRRLLDPQTVSALETAFS